jgi:hypothetical protein
MTRVVPSRSAVNSGLNFFIGGLNLKDVETCIATTSQLNPAYEPPGRVQQAALTWWALCAVAKKSQAASLHSTSVSVQILGLFL